MERNLNGNLQTNLDGGVIMAKCSQRKSKYKEKTKKTTELKSKQNTIEVDMLKICGDFKMEQFCNQIQVEQFQD